jgi:hypothetical protein
LFRTFSLLALLALPAFAEGAADAGTAAPAPTTTKPATTASPKGQGVKKVKPGATTTAPTEAPKPVK